MSRWATVPNLLTALRLILAPWAWSAIAAGNYRTALYVLAAAGFSDAIDGFVARRFNAQSELGEKLDPVADKILVAGVFAALFLNHRLPGWMLALVFGRDLLILGFAAWAIARGLHRTLKPTLWGKCSTLLQLLLGGGLVLEPALQWTWLAPVNSALLAASAGMTAWSGLHYGWIGWKITRQNRPSSD
jgi:cardiolipin synthase